jgi:hypothetical protein
MESTAGVLGFLMFLQLIFLLALLAGGLYALFALGRAAAGLDRLASAVEAWVERQEKIAPSALAESTPLPAPAVPLPEVLENHEPIA